MKDVWVINKIHLRHLTQRNSYKFMNVIATWENYWQMMLKVNISQLRKKKILRAGRGSSAFQEYLHLNRSPGSWVRIILSSIWIKVQESQIVSSRDRSSHSMVGRRPSLGFQELQLSLVHNLGFQEV